MQANPLLSIVIPTYNRAEFLDNCLKFHIPLARAHNIQLVISDNASTDNTPDVLNKRTEEYPLIRYYRNESNVGPEQNFELALKYPGTQYVWLLGDTYRIPSAGISYVLNLIADNDQKYDAIVCNLSGKIEDVCTQDFTDNNSLLSSLGALMTCLSCLVYSMNLIRNADFSRYINTNFMQTGIIFEAIARQPFNIHWAQSISVEGFSIRSLKKKSWSDTPHVFNIACTNWANFVFSLPPAYALENKLKCIMDFTKVSNVFSFSHLLSLRKRNILNYKIYNQYHHLFPLTIRFSKSIILMIVLLPRFIPRMLLKTRRVYRRLVKSGMLPKLN